MTPLVLPWPSPLLGPNSRAHFRARAAATKEARRVGAVLALHAGWHGSDLPEGRLHLWVTFHPPTKRMPDDDNMLGRFKAYRDGIADTLGIDDKRFISHPFVSDQPHKGGEVVVKITGGPAHAG